MPPLLLLSRPTILQDCWQFNELFSVLKSQEDTFSTSCLIPIPVSTNNSTSNFNNNPLQVIDLCCLTSARDWIHTRPMVFDDGTCSTLDSEDASHFQDHIFRRTPAWKLASQFYTNNLSNINGKRKKKLTPFPFSSQNNSSEFFLRIWVVTILKRIKSWSSRMCSQGLKPRMRPTEGRSILTYHPQSLNKKAGNGNPNLPMNHRPAV